MNSNFLISNFRGRLKNSPNTDSGFSIVEVLVASFVFSIMSVIVAAIFINTLDLQRRGNAAKIIQEETLFSVELMTREIRVSEIRSSNDPNCNSTSLSINHPINGLASYSISNGVLNRTVGGITSQITSSKISFSRLNFCVNGAGIDDKQPRVTIIASVQSPAQPELKFDMQTTVTSRDMREELLN